MNDSEFYPCGYRMPDSQSLRGQRNFTRYQKALNILLVVFGVITAFPVLPQFFKLTLYGSATLLACIFILMATDKPKEWEAQWYLGRAIAESTKSMSWKYSYNCDPYRDSPEQFRKDIEKLIRNYKFSAHDFDAESDFSPTSEMESIRSSAWADKLAFYKKERLENQIEWYGRRSALNKKKYDQWKIMTMVVLAISFIGIMFTQDNLRSLSIPLMSMCSLLVLSFQGWSQFRRHNELFESYGATKIELIMINNKSSEVDGNDDLAKFVSDAETAISREHTSWLARRGQISY